MNTILIVYLSRTGQTEKMAVSIAKGVELAEKKVQIKKLHEIKNAETLNPYDGLVFGCPTYYRSITDGMKRLLFMASNTNLAGKVGGAFGSYIYSGESGDIIYDTMRHVFKMKMIDSGALTLKEHVLETVEGIKACRNYGKAIADMLE
jgi:flavodoxin